jgi:hypothetical protein
LVCVGGDHRRSPPHAEKGETIEELILIAEASFIDEYKDSIIYWPLT